MDVDADCAYTGFVQHDVTSLLHAVKHTVVIVMTTVMPNPRFCKFRGHIILFKVYRIARSISIYFAQLGPVSDNFVHPRALPSAWDRRNYQTFAILQEAQLFFYRIIGYS